MKGNGESNVGGGWTDGIVIGKAGTADGRETGTAAEARKGRTHARRERDREGGREAGTERRHAR